MSHSNYTERSDTATRADSARDARHNGGDWPTSYRPLWIHRTTRKRHASTCAWFHEGLRLSLVVWLSQYQRRCGQWTAVNIDPPKEERSMKINYDQAEMINATDYHDAPKWSLAYCLAIAARYERLAYRHPDDEECAMQAWWWRELARGDYSTPRLHYFAGMALETWPLYGVWKDAP